MKKAFYLVLLIPFCVFGQNPEIEKGIHFEHTSFALLLEKAKKENKMVMVDAYTTWCGPCKWMAKNIFTNDTVASYFNTNFVNAKIDMERGEGVEIAKKYQVACYPTYLFMDGNGQLLHRISGSMEAAGFIAVGMNALDPAKQFTAYQKKYDSGKTTPDEMAEYVLMRGHSCLPVKVEMTKYFSTQTEADLLKQRNWNILSENAHNLDVESREFKYLVDHKLDFEKLYKTDKVNELIRNSYNATLNKFSREKNSEKYTRVKEEIARRNFPFSEEIILNADMSLYKSTKDWNKYGPAAIKYIEKFKKEDSNALNNMAWTFYENIDDKALLAKAEGWIKHAVELDPGYFNYDTYAAILYKLGKKTEAKAVAEKAIELAKKEGEDYAETQALLDKIKAME